MPEPAQRVAYTKTDKAGALGVILGASLWGLFWIPLRHLDEAGINGLWSIAMVLLCALLPALIVTACKRQLCDLLTTEPWLIGYAMGLSMVLYFVGILYSDVIRVIFLFYLLPVWTTISARVIYGEPLNRAKMVVVALSLLGLWLLLGGGRSLPIPKNIGDWSAIGAGMCWGISLSLLRGRQLAPTYASTTTTLAAALLLSLSGALIFSLAQSTGHASLPTWTNIKGVLLVSAAFGILAIYPALLGQIWGAKRIPAPTAALLTMSEILVATLSAYLLIGTDLAPLSWLGGAIILVAVCISLHNQYGSIDLAQS
jgi:drug/metabolite transporter (DMT)-like permease